MKGAGARVLGFGIVFIQVLALILNLLIIYLLDDSTIQSMPTIRGILPNTDFTQDMRCQSQVAYTLERVFKSTLCT